VVGLIGLSNCGEGMICKAYNLGIGASENSGVVAPEYWKVVAEI